MPQTCRPKLTATQQNVCVQIAPHLQSFRTHYKSVATDASMGFPGFLSFLQTSAQAPSNRLFTDQVT